MKPPQIAAVALAFVTTLIIAMVALSLAFDSTAIAVAPALIVAGALSAAVYLSQRKTSQRKKI